jgi:hypothetical protein
MLEPVNLTRYVATDYLAAVQGIAALEQRIAEIRSWPGDFRDEIDAARRLVLALRAAFGIHEMSEAEIDAAHEQAVTELDRFIEENSPDMSQIDIPEAFASYQAEGR